MADRRSGAGWPDVALAMIDWARSEPLNFLMVVPTFMATVTGAVILFYRSRRVRPLKAQKEQFDGERQAARKKAGARKGRGSTKAVGGGA